MDKKEFYNQMIALGQELLAEEQKPKLNKEEIDNLQKLYDHLAGAVNAAADLEDCFVDINRPAKVRKAIELIMEVQELMNSLAEDDDIQIGINGKTSKIIRLDW